MPGPLVSLERFFERLFERPAARLFRTRLQPVQLQRRLERAMEADRRIGVDRTYVPNRYRIRLNPGDLAAFASYQGTLEEELADALLGRARARGYTLVERPHVTLEDDATVVVGEIEVEAEVLDPLLLRPAPSGFRRVAETDVEGRDIAVEEGDGGSVERTAVFDLPKVVAPRIVLEVRDPTGSTRRLELSGGRLRFGRAADNEVPLADERVSRHHGQLGVRQGTLVYRDLDSTNGSFLNGEAVREIALGPGDVLQLGDTTITIHEG